MSWLADLVRDAVQTANDVVDDGGALVDVTHRAYLGQDEFGAPQYAAAVVRPALVEDYERVYRVADGKESMSQHKVTFLANVPVTTQDSLTLPDGTTAPILDINGLQDGTHGGRYLTIVVLGTSVRSQV